jgi:DNA polymerase alpha-associated DNA helicase A
VELIYQLLLRPARPSSNTTQPPRILITTPSNLALDNLLLRLQVLSSKTPYSEILHRENILRLGHPTRVHRDLVATTLDYKARNGEDGELVRDVGREIEGVLGELGKKRGEKGSVKGKERGKKWEDVRELRKESVSSFVLGTQLIILQVSTKRRESGHKCRERCSGECLLRLGRHESDTGPGRFSDMP